MKVLDILMIVAVVIYYVIPGLLYLSAAYRLLKQKAYGLGLFAIVIAFIPLLNWGPWEE